MLIEAVLFFIGIETWKWAKRVYFQRQARKATGGIVDLDERVLGRYYSMAGGSQDEEWRWAREDSPVSVRETVLSFFTFFFVSERGG